MNRRKGKKEEAKGTSLGLQLILQAAELLKAYAHLKFKQLALRKK
jgi:hypothetical protein